MSKGRGCSLSAHQSSLITHHQVNWTCILTKLNWETFIVRWTKSLRVRLFCEFKYCSSYQVSGQICVTSLPGNSHQWSQAIGCEKLTSRNFFLSPRMVTLLLTFPKLTVSRHGKAVDLLIGVGRNTKDFFAIFLSQQKALFSRPAVTTKLKEIMVRLGTFNL